MRKSILLPVVKANDELCLKIKTLLEEEYLESFMTLGDFSSKYDICISAIKYVLDKYNLIKDLKKYNPSKNPDNIQKIAKTKLFRYGSSTYNNSEKNKSTRLKKYDGKYFSDEGIENLRKPLSDDIKNKQKSTMLEKYGVANIFSDKDYIQKCFMEKYGDGITNPGQVKTIQEKVKLTNLTKYGCERTFSCNDIKQKIKQTNLDRYGCENPNQNEAVKKKSHDTRIRNGTQLLDGSELDTFLSSWNLDRKPTVSDYKIWIENLVNKSYDLTNVYKMIPEDKEIFFTKRISFFECIVEDFLKENKIEYQKHNREEIYPQELDFYLPQYHVGLEVNDIWSHNSSKGIFGNPPKDIKYHFNKTNICEENGIRLIHIFEPHLLNEHKWKVLQDIILHACHKSKSIPARKTILVIDKPLKYKSFFEENNINGYRKSNKAFMLLDKITKEPLMGYLVGDAYFGKGKYDAEISRGACKLGYSIVGGASKIWKGIIDYYSTLNLKDTPGKVNSIIYYVDRNYYNGKSMTFLPNIEFIKNQPGFWNYSVIDKQLHNRDPKHHKEMKLKEQLGEILVVGNSGTQVNVWHRNK